MNALATYRNLFGYGRNPDNICRHCFGDTVPAVDLLNNGFFQKNNTATYKIRKMWKEIKQEVIDNAEKLIKQEEESGTQQQQQ